MRWISLSADQGLADAQFNLAVLLEHGMGTERDTARALILYNLAVKSGVVGAEERRDKLAAQF